MIFRFRVVVKRVSQAADICCFMVEQGVLRQKLGFPTLQKRRNDYLCSNINMCYYGSSYKHSFQF